MLREINFELINIELECQRLIINLYPTSSWVYVFTFGYYYVLLPLRIEHQLSFEHKL